MQDKDTDSQEEGSEGVALEAAAALAAISALVASLQAFLSPHLSALLHLLFSPPVLACKQAKCSETAGSIRIQLAGVMPPRLLLAPMFAHFDGAVKVRHTMICPTIDMCLNQVFSVVDSVCCVAPTACA